jgi:hypothetical protein
LIKVSNNQQGSNATFYISQILGRQSAPSQKGGYVKYKEDSYVICPYYRKETPIEIKCGGGVGSHTINVFKSRRAKEAYKEDFCCTYAFEGCAINQMIKEQEILEGADL